MNFATHNHSRCQCFVIPSFILENLSRQGVENARVSLSKSKQVRKKRRLKEYDINGVAALTDAGDAVIRESARHVYDSQGSTNLRVKLVRREGQGAAGDASADEVYEHAGIVRDYFKNVLNRNSIDNHGLDIILNCHYGHNFMNAFWDGDEMVFGDGDGVIFSRFTKSLDVVAHELTHGVTQFIADLEYEGQSGALNEHFSDVFGIAIKQYHLNQTAQQADWLIGADIMGPDLKGQALRSMKAPGTAYDNQLMGKDPQPDHMNKFYTGENDRGGVHINSGIPNKVFYLVAMEIGTSEAALIWYQALQALHPTSDFQDYARALSQSAQQVSQAGKVSKTAVQTVQKALQQVGILDQANNPLTATQRVGVHS